VRMGLEEPALEISTPEESATPPPRSPQSCSTTPSIPALASRPTTGFRERVSPKMSEVAGRAPLRRVSTSSSPNKRHDTHRRRRSIRVVNSSWCHVTNNRMTMLHDSHLKCATRVRR